METLKRSFFQFHYHKFIEQRNSILSFHYSCVTRGRRGRGLSCTFFKIGKKCSDFGKKSPHFGHFMWSSHQISHLNAIFSWS